MRRSEVQRGSEVVVLRTGDAIAVVMDCVGETASARLTAVQAALRAATGRGDIVISLRASGRPRLAPPYPDLGISISHRNDLIAAAFSPTRDVGVDMELPAHGLEAARLGIDHFRPLEAARVAKLSEPAASDLFLRLWVAKEAALKVTGRGVFDGLDEPDLASVTDVIRGGADGEAPVSIHLPASARLPAIVLELRRLTRPDGRTVYCALACLT